MNRTITTIIGIGIAILFLLFLKQVCTPVINHNDHIDWKKYDECMHSQPSMSPDGCMIIAGAGR